jgi:hypothetical protein
MRLEPVNWALRLVSGAESVHVGEKVAGGTHARAASALEVRERAREAANDAMVVLAGADNDALVVLAGAV